MRIPASAAFCTHHWNLVPVPQRKAIAHLSVRVQSGECDAAQQRLVAELRQARDIIAQIEQHRRKNAKPSFA